jgi:hypothetical protein
MILRENIDLILKDSAKNIDPEPHIKNVIEWLKDSPCKEPNTNMMGDAIGYYINGKIKCFGKTVDGIHAVVFIGTPKEVSHFESVEFPKYILERIYQ